MSIKKLIYLESKKVNMEFEQLFLESQGQPILYKGKELIMIDKINLLNNEANFKIKFLKTDSHLMQGIMLETKGVFKVNGKKASIKIVLWENTAPEDINVCVNSKNKEVIIYNVWKSLDETIHYWHNGGAMYVQYFDNYRIYNCNDGFPDDDLNDLIFKIEF